MKFLDSKINNIGEKMMKKTIKIFKTVSFLKYFDKNKGK